MSAVEIAPEILLLMKNMLKHGREKKIAPDIQSHDRHKTENSRC